MVSSFHFFTDGTTDVEREEARSQYFVGHEFTRRKIDDLRRAVERALGCMGLMPYYADQEVQQAHILEKIARKVLMTRFGIFDISSGKPNVLIELGIAIGLNKPCLVIAEEGTAIPSMLQGHSSVFVYRDLLELECRLRSTVPSWLEDGIAHHLHSAYCNFCGQSCEARGSTDQENAYLLVDSPEREGDWRSFRSALETALEPFPISATALSDLSSRGWLLCDFVRKIRSTRLCLCRISRSSAAEVFLAIGIATGLEAPLLYVIEEGFELPSNLKGIDRFEYRSYVEIEDSFPRRTRGILLGLTETDRARLVKRIRAALESGTDSDALDGLGVALESFSVHKFLDQGDITGLYELTEYDELSPTTIHRLLQAALELHPGDSRYREIITLLYRKVGHKIDGD